MGAKDVLNRFLGHVTAKRVNAASFMASLPGAPGSTMESRQPLSQDQLKKLYRTNWIARKVCDLYAADMVSAGVEWDIDADTSELLEKEFRRLQVWGALEQAVKLARLYGGSIILMGTAAPDPMSRSTRAEGTARKPGNAQALFCLRSLPHGLKQADAACHRDVETFHGPQHRDFRKLIASLAGELSEPLAFGAEHPSKGALLVKVINRLFRFSGRSHHQYARFPKFHNACGKVGDAYNGHCFPGACGSFGRCRRKRGRAVLGRHNRLHTRGVRDTQAGAEVTGIGDAVKNQKQCLIGDAVKQLIKGERIDDFVRESHHTLMRQIRRKAVEPSGIGLHNLDAGLIEPRAALMHALVAALRVHINHLHTLGL